MGNEFRDYIFANQLEVTPQNLRSFAEKFAAEHKVDLPFVVDPQGKLAALINADKNTARRSRSTTRPRSTWSATSVTRSSHSWKWLIDRSSQLYALIDNMLHE